MSQVATIHKGKVSTGFKVELTDEEKVVYHGQDPGGLKKWFEWAKENLDDTVIYDGRNHMDLLPVRKYSFWYWVWQTLTYLNATEGTELSAEFAGVPLPLSDLPQWKVETKY